jgi:hypothetical protein
VGQGLQSGDATSALSSKEAPIAEQFEPNQACAEDEPRHRRAEVELVWFRNAARISQSAAPLLGCVRQREPPSRARGPVGAAAARSMAEQEPRPRALVLSEAFPRGRAR